MSCDVETAVMKTCSKCNVSQELFAFSKDRTIKDGLRRQCKGCVKAQSKVWSEANKDRKAETGRVWHEANPEYDKAYYEKNKPKHSALVSAWQKANRAKCNASLAKYRATKAKATPHWLTIDHLKQIEQFYIDTQTLTLATGTTYHVDHIVPLQGDTVCGLHVPWNLQVITAVENQSKSNKFQG